MRVAMVSTVTPYTHYSYYLAKELNKILDNFVVYCQKDEKVNSKDFKAVNCWDSNFKFLFQIIRQVKKDKIDVVHLQHEINMYGGVVGILLFPILILALRVLKIKVIVTIHAVVNRRLVDNRFLKTFNYKPNKFMQTLVRNGFWYLYHSTLKLGNKIIVHSDSIKKDLSTYGQVRKVHVIPHGVPNNEVYSVTKIEEKFWEKIKDKKVILCFGYVSRRKGIEYLINGFAKIAKDYMDWILVIGGGILRGQEDYFSELNALAKKREIASRVIFTGFVEKSSSVDKLYNYSKIVVLPAKFSISSSGVVAQAIGFEKPLIVNDLGTFSEDIEDEKEGILVKPLDSKDFAKKLDILMKDEKLQKRITTNLKKMKKDRLWNKIALKTNLVYGEGLSE